MTTAIEFHDVSLSYRRYIRKPLTLKEAVIGMFRGVQYETFWVLKNVDFQVQPGTSLGIIGRNGVGKSTLLKAIAGVLPPQSGRVTTHGRIAPLLALGGSFNLELTGRENIFLSGAIMGLSRRQMETKADSIIDFASVGDFIDAPLHTYSSGMRARLGFAIATDVDPEILLLDEIFSVGDEAFRRKAEERMRSFFKSQRTVVTVSHNLSMVEELCDRVIWLNEQGIGADGEPVAVIEQYRAYTKEKAS